MDNSPPEPDEQETDDSSIAQPLLAQCIPFNDIEAVDGLIYLRDVRKLPAAAIAYGSEDLRWLPAPIPGFPVGCGAIVSLLRDRKGELSGLGLEGVQSGGAKALDEKGKTFRRTYPLRPNGVRDGLYRIAGVGTGNLLCYLVEGRLAKAVAIAAIFDAPVVYGWGGRNTLGYCAPDEMSVVVVEDARPADEQRAAEHDRELEAGCDRLVIAGKMVSRTGDPPHGYKDIDAALAGGVSVQELREWLLGAQPYELSVDGWARKIGETIKDPLRQAQETQKAIDQLGLGRGMVGAFRKQVAKYARRAPAEEDEEPAAGSGGGMVYRPVPTASEPQDPRALADDIADALRRHAYTAETAITVCTLWLLHSERRSVSELGVLPRLIIDAAVPDSGKTHLALALKHMMERCEHIVSPRPSNIYRTIEKYGAAFVLDECDQWYRRDIDMQELINSGYNRDGASVLRTEDVAQPGSRQRQLEPRRFSTFTPMILVGIDAYRILARTVVSRALVVHMEPSREGEEREDLFDNPQAVARLRTIAGRIKRFLVDAERDLRFVVPDKPAGVRNRLWITWRALLAMAQHIGGPWPPRALEALAAAQAITPDAGTALQLLRDTYVILLLAKDNRLHTSALIDELLKLELRPYTFFGKTRAVIYDTEVARLLGTYGVKSKQTKIGGRNKNGYSLDAVFPAIERYSPSIISEWAQDGVYQVYRSTYGHEAYDSNCLDGRPSDGHGSTGSTDGATAGSTSAEVDPTRNQGLPDFSEQNQCSRGVDPQETLKDENKDNATHTRPNGADAPPARPKRRRKIKGADTAPRTEGL